MEEWPKFTADGGGQEVVEVSVVIPCLNETETVGLCVGKAVAAMREAGLDGEIVVADNGSVDGSQVIAADAGARVVAVAEKGYGAALMGGIEASRGRFVIMGDADDSYDFAEVPRFVGRLREGYALVQGCRLPSGGGRILPGAMPFLHRWWGNPMFSWLARRWFGAPIHDVYCGLRGFTRDLYTRLDLRSTGMEFATEMIVKASLAGERIAEVPITLYPDGRKSRAPHLRTFRDGWRTLRFFLLYSPRWLFLLPGLLLVGFGLLGYALAMPGVTVRGFGGWVLGRWGWTTGAVTFDAHTLLFASLAILCGYQAVLFAAFAKTFAVAEGLLPGNAGFRRWSGVINLERGIALGSAGLAVGLALLAGAVWQWYRAGFGPLDYARTMRWVVPGATLTAVGFQTVLASFFISILMLRRK